MPLPLRTLSLVAGALGMAAAFLAGRWTATVPAPPRAPQSEAPSRLPFLTVAGPPSGVGPDELRRIVREELALALREEPPRTSPPAAPAAMPEAEPGATPEALAAATGARSLLETAASRRRFTESDGDRWLSLLSQLPAKERFELERRLAVAVNRDEIVPDPGTFPLYRPESR